MVLDLTQLLEVLVMLVSVVITGCLIPFLKTKISQDKLDEIMVWVKAAVNAAEQIYKGTSRGTEKKEYVVKFLEGKGIKLDTDVIDTLIESAVLELNNAIEQEEE